MSNDSRRYDHKKQWLVDYKDKVVTMKNSLIKASHGLSVSEKKVICIAISKINSLVGAEADRTVSVNIDEVALYCNNDRTVADNMLRNGSKKLFDRDITFQRIDSDGGKILRFREHWLDQEVIKENGQVSLKFGDEVFKMLTDIAGKYTSYSLESVMRLNSKCAIRLFELMMQRHNQNRLQDDITKAYLLIKTEDLNLAMELSPSAIKNNHLAKRHIYPAVNEINKALKLDIKFEERRDSWKFTYLTREQVEFKEFYRNQKESKRIGSDEMHAKIIEREMKAAAKKGIDVSAMAARISSTAKTKVGKPIF